MRLRCQLRENEGSQSRIFKWTMAIVHLKLLDDGLDIICMRHRIFGLRISEKSASDPKDIESRTLGNSNSDGG